jgi:hypothetical protein
MDPEVIRADERRFDDDIAEQIAWLMDSSIRIGPYSIGLDALIGLIPGLGDVATNMMSAVIIMRAMQHGVSKPAIMRMLLNLGVDTAVGSIPVVGDLFDFAYKANTKNLRIYRESLGGTRKPLKDWGFIILVMAFLLAMIVLPVLGLIYLAQVIFSRLQ